MPQRVDGHSHGIVGANTSIQLDRDFKALAHDIERLLGQWKPRTTNERHGKVLLIRNSTSSVSCQPEPKILFRGSRFARVCGYNDYGRLSVDDKYLCNGHGTIMLYYSSKVV